MPDVTAVFDRSAAAERIAALRQHRDALRMDIRIPPGIFESQYHITPFTAHGGGDLQPELFRTRAEAILASLYSPELLLRQAVEGDAPIDHEAEIRLEPPRFEITPPDLRRAWMEQMQGPFGSAASPRHDDMVDAHSVSGFRGLRASMVIMDDVVPSRRVPLRPRSGAIESLTLSAEELRGLAAKTPAQLKSWAVDMANRATPEQPF